MDKTLSSMHPLEREVLPHLKEGISAEKLIDLTGLKYVEVMRALQWMESKNLLEIETEEKKVVKLGKNGKTYQKKGLPEKRFLIAVENKKLNFKEIRDNAKLDKDELNVCLGILRKKLAIDIKKGKVSITKQGKKLLEKEMLEEKILKKDFPLQMDELKEEELYAVQELSKRKGILNVDIHPFKLVRLTKKGKKVAGKKIKGEFEERLTQDMLKDNSWKKKTFRRYDITIDVPRVYPGKRHFTKDAIDFVKKIWLELGFKEMTGSFVQVGFWNFDALFTAQDHPVRELQDTYYIKEPQKGKLLRKDVVERVRKTHENGWTTGSTGWQYKWDPEEAMKNVLRTHTTCLSARQISNLSKEDLPAKFFAVGKNFRNETLDWSHLFELIQVEGIVIDPDANFKHLIGYLKDFFKKMGYPKVRVRPGYFPYTEPSAEVDVYHPVHKKWLELGGSGMFRPEVTKPLFGEEIPVLAWGLGFDRSILEYYGLTDIRDLYKNDLDQMKKMKVWTK